MASPIPRNLSSGKQSISLPFWLGVLFILIIAIGWLAEVATREQLTMDTGKFWDVINSSGSGWSPSFMMGHSMQVYNACAIAMTLTETAYILLGGIFSHLFIHKLVILTFIPASALSMWFLMRRLGAGSALSAWSALFYIVLPSINVAIGIYEHWTVGLCFVFTPLLLRGILAVAEEGSPREIVGLGLAASALTLSYN